MNYRPFGKTDLRISEIGFGCWAIGGPVNVGNIPIGWGNLDSKEAVLSIRKALDLGINFFDTADFYGLGQSEKLLGAELGNNPHALIATKVGHRVDARNNIYTDYSKDHIIQACEASLTRLRRDTIDYYQLHTAKVKDLEEGSCLEALEILKAAGKIRYWGLSIHTYQPEAESNYLSKNALGDGLQLVFNVINQRASSIIQNAAQSGYGIIARMPLQFGLLTDKFNGNSTFPSNDHRSFRLPRQLIKILLPKLNPIREMTEKYDTSMTGLSLSFPLSYPEVSTVIPGMKTVAQVDQNVKDIVRMNLRDRKEMERHYASTFYKLVNEMQLVETGQR